MKNSLTILLLVLLATCYAQQDASYSQYLQNRTFYNPAAAGMQKQYRFAAVSQSLLDVSGIRRMNTISVDGPLGEVGQGLGVQLWNDNGRYLQTSGFAAMYSHRVYINDGYLSLGLRGGLMQTKLGSDAVTAKDPQDVKLDGDQGISPDLTAGVLYHANQYYLGYSMAHLLGERWSAHHYAMGSFWFDPADRMTVTLGSIMRMVPGNSTVVEWTAQAEVFESFFCGVQATTVKTFGVYAGVNIDGMVSAIVNPMYIGYSVSTTREELKSTWGPIHEIMFSYSVFRRNNVDFVKSRTKITSPTFFE